MTDKEIFEQAIQKSLDGGWTVNDWTDTDDFSWDVEEDELFGLLMHYTGMGDDWYLSPWSVLFDIDFAKALWGKRWDEDDGCKVHGKIHSYPGDPQGDTVADPWEYHLMEMVAEVNRMKYLEANI